MEEKMDIKAELSALENEMGRIMVGSTQDEIGETRKEITKLSMRIEDLLVNEARLPRNIVETLVQNMHDRLTLETCRNIASTREKEYDESKYNLSTVEQDTPKGTADNLERFSQDGGVAINDNKYAQSLEQICEEVFNEYKMRLSRVNDRRVDEAIYDIRKMIGKTSQNMQDIHESYSRSIVNEVSRRASELGMTINKGLLEKVDEEIAKCEKESCDETNKPFGDEPAVTNDFASSLRGQTKTVDEVTQGDVASLTDNERAFGDEPSISNSSRQQLEDMFK